MNFRAAALGLVLTLSGIAPCLAHPGHGTPGLENTASHYVTEPSHLATWVSAAGIALAVAFGAAEVARMRGRRA